MFFDTILLGSKFSLQFLIESMKKSKCRFRKKCGIRGLYEKMTIVTQVSASSPKLPINNPNPNYFYQEMNAHY
jgi:hypothetical protein